MSGDVDFRTIAGKTADFTGADLKALLYNAMVLAANRALRQQGEYDQMLTLGLGATTPVISRGRYSLERELKLDEDDSTPIVSPKNSPLWHPQGGSAGGSFSEHFGSPDATHSTPERSSHQVTRIESEPEREMVLEFGSRDGKVRMHSSQRLHDQVSSTPVQFFSVSNPSTLFF